VLSFDPEVLRRFVNFMNNPDEDTAVAQFGKGDKYFGVATLMVTLPGLPLFGHGQIEGFGEKYGMEYRRAYWDESPDPDFVARHEREIFPLLRRRALFSGAAHFALFDFETDGGSPNEDVFAYANRAGPDRALVVYHNRFGDTRGRVRRAAGTGATLARALDLPAGEDDVWTWTDLRTGLHHMGRGRRLAEEGLAMALGAYACHVLLDMRAVRDPGAGALCDWLAGRGVDSLEEASRQRERERAGSALSRALARASVESLFAGPARGEGKVLFVERMDAVLSALERLHAPARPRAALLAELGERARRAAGLDAPSPFLRSVVAASLVVAVLDEATGAEQEGEELVTAEGMAALQAALSHPAPDGERALLLSRLAARAGLDRCQDPCEVLPDLLDRDGAATFLGVNLHDGILWFSREGLADLLAGLEAVWAVVHPGGGAEAAAGAGAAWLGLGEAHGWRWEPFRRAAAQEEEEGGEEPDGGRV